MGMTLTLLSGGELKFADILLKIRLDQLLRKTEQAYLFMSN
jgi:hypothetical protein